VLKSADCHFRHRVVIHSLKGKIFLQEDLSHSIYDAHPALSRQETTSYFPSKSVLIETQLDGGVAGAVERSGVLQWWSEIV